MHSHFLSSTQLRAASWHGISGSGHATLKVFCLVVLSGFKLDAALATPQSNAALRILVESAIYFIP